ncbi:DMT family transporter [Catenovulum sp. SM1970]|uniref:DMT family transporter n=1 Tax=Marinifaba aquimaris TaxID=2741323 RepID=UPI001571617A|nr:DMT family transporter [Marinifaba aquimaris]NTS77922.1 DMT family transporter [Marinifaba aquimaris]
MSVPAAYLTVILIWSTTPLGIVWSAESMSPQLAVFIRMSIALVIGLGLIALWRIKLPFSKAALKLYFYSSLGIYLGMMFSYLSGQYISSGLMSLIFGLSPIISGLFAQHIIAEPKMGNIKKAALGMALCGLFIVCIDNIALKHNSVIGIVLILLSVICFSLSAVLVKSVKIDINPLASTIGTLVISTPLYAMTWYLTDGNFEPSQWTERSISAIVYLGVFGSLLGFVAYFYTLQKLKTSTVALITLITPVIAIALGISLNNEQVSPSFINGAITIILGLALYLFGEKLGKSKYLKSEVE